MKPALQKIICLALFCFLQSAFAENRFLFIVDTSSPMKRRMPEVEKTTRELVLSGINNELRHGDTFTIWTFNDQLSAGKFPMQIWRPENKTKIAEAAAQFVAGQRCEKTARFDRVKAEMFRVVADSEKLVVIIFTDGMTALRGTPFDGKINAVFEKHRDELREGKTAFVVALLADSGKFVSYTMNSTAGPIWMPLPPGVTAPPTKPEAEKKTAEAVPVTITAPPATSPPPVVEIQTPVAPKLIDSALVSPSPGLKPIPPEKISEPVVLKTNAATIPTLSAVTNAPPSPVKQTAPVAKVNPDKKNNSEPAVKPVTNLPVIAARPPVVMTSAPPKISSPVAVVKIIPATTNKPIARPAIQKTQAVVVVQPKPVAVQQPKPRVQSPPTVAVSIPPPDSKTGNRLLIAAALLIVVLVVLMALRKPRATPRGSLITRSFENPRPPKKD